MIKVQLSEIRDLPKIKELFQGIQDSMLISFFQGYMGDLWVNSLENPITGLIVSGEYSFYGGAVNTKQALSLNETLFDYIDGDKTTAIFSQDSMKWRNLLLSFSKFGPKEIIRHGIVQKDYVFDKDKLTGFIESIPKTYSIRAFDEALYSSSLKEEWSQEFCETFYSYEEYKKQGFAYGIMKNGLLVAGASTMTVYNEGFEIQVATREGYRGQGLALAASASLLLEGIKRNLRPCWDAENEASLHIALKLGYEYMGEYSTVRLYKA